MQPSVYQRNAILYGIIGGFIFLLTHIGAWKMGLPAYISVVRIETFIPYVIGLLILGGLQMRNKNGGFLSYADALKFAFLAYIIIVLFEGITNYVLFNIIDKNLTNELLDASKNQVITMMKKLGATQDKIDEAVKNMNEKKDTNFKTILLGSGTSLIWDFAKAAVIALIIRKEKPVTEN